MTDEYGDGKLELAARHYQYDETLEKAANLFDTDPQAWLKLPVILQDRSGLYRDARADYRRAVKAGVVSDDRGPHAAPKGATA